MRVSPVGSLPQLWNRLCPPWPASRMVRSLEWLGISRPTPLLLATTGACLAAGRVGAGLENAPSFSLCLFESPQGQGFVRTGGRGPGWGRTPQGEPQALP